tara:strand:+ start:2139 stop:2420 length:282 start_codon:yes stop_codon:yes gene_type:complete
MPEIKIIVDKEEYTLQCEPGEENELNKAVEVVNEKMEIFKNEPNIKKNTKLLMVSLLIASESNSHKIESLKDRNKILEIVNLLQKLERTIDKL